MKGGGELPEIEREILMKTQNSKQSYNKLQKCSIPHNSLLHGKPQHTDLEGHGARKMEKITRGEGRKGLGKNILPQTKYCREHLNTAQESLLNAVTTKYLVSGVCVVWN